MPAPPERALPESEPPLRDRAASVPILESSGTAHPRRRRALATLTVATVAAAGLAAAGALPASANPGNVGGVSSYEHAFTANSQGAVTDVAVDSYTAQVFVARPGAVDILDEFSGEYTGSIPLPGTSALQLDADATRSLVWVLDPAHNMLS